MSKIITYRLPDDFVSRALKDLAKIILNHILAHEDWLGLQLTVMRDGTITYDVQVEEVNN